MPRRAIIDRDRMLEAFGYDLSKMTPDAKTSAAWRMEQVNGLQHFYLAGKRERHYWKDEVEAKAQPVLIN